MILTTPQTGTETATEAKKDSATNAGITLVAFKPGQTLFCIQLNADSGKYELSHAAHLLKPVRTKRGVQFGFYKQPQALYIAALNMINAQYLLLNHLNIKNELQL